MDPLPSGIIHPSFYPFLLPAMLYLVFSIFPHLQPAGHPLRAMNRLPRPLVRMLLF